MAKYIRRIDKDETYTHGWIVSYPKDPNNITDVKGKYFPDRKHGGKRKSFSAAKNFRDNKYNELSLSYLITRITSSRQRSRTKKGIVGVRYYDDLKRSPYWQACGCKYKKKWNKRFNSYINGDVTAFLMACRERHKHHGTLFIHGRIKDLPCRPDVPYKLIKSK